MRRREHNICERTFPENEETYIASGTPPEPAEAVGASRSSVIRCKPGANCPSTQTGLRRQHSPLSAAEDSAAPILELQRGEEGTQTQAENSSQESHTQTRCESCTSTFLKILWGFLIILSVSSSWIGTTQIVKITYKNFDYPFFMTWFSTNWNIMFFPVYYSGHLATAQEKQSPIKKI
ncbi:Solute carrier family 35 member F4, partial [Ophiophagus hannah]